MPTASSSPRVWMQPATPGGGVLGSGAGMSPSGGAEAVTAPSAAATGELPYAGLALPAVLVIGLALLLGGSLAWRVGTPSEGRAA
jgi:hypothetical protein